MSKLIQEIMDALNAVQKNKTEPYDRSGTVKRIEGKIAWVQLEGSDRETPIQMTIACDVGDTVQARIGGGSAWLTGNLTAPPTDDKKANEAISMVTTVVQEVQEQVEEALEDVSDVEDVTMQYCLSDSSSTFTQYGDWSNTPPTYVSGKYYWTRSVLVDDDGNETYGEPRYSQDTQLSVETDVAFKSNNNHFWHDSSGAYVTTANKNYSSGYATRITSSGILQSYSGNLLSSWTSSGISFYQGDASNTLTASFGSGGVNLYAGGSLGASIASSGMTLYAYGTKLAEFVGQDCYFWAGSDYMKVGASGITYYHSATGTQDFVVGASGSVRVGSTLYVVDEATFNKGASVYNGELYVDGTVYVESDTTIDGLLYVTSQTGATSTAKPNCHITSNGIFRYTSYDVSSKKYKNSISKVIDKSLDPHKLYDIEVVQFKYNKDIVSDENDQRYDTPLIGFIAEQVAEVYPVAVELKDAQKDNEVDSWCDQYIIPPMLALIQEQNKRITALEEKLS